MMGSKFKLALIQLSVGSNKAENLARAVSKISEAVKKGADVVSLPECFNSPYGTQYFKEYAEKIPAGPSCEALRAAAAENKVYLIGGSIPECSDGKYFNTCTVWCPQGNLLATHRKIHLFDIDIPGKMTFKESDALSPGNQLTTFSTPWCEVGLGICYDIRFAPLAQVYAKKQCKLVVYPGAFNMTTGPAHWELLARARALDNQLFVATPSPARDTSASYVAWGHSSIVGPWGDLLARAGPEEEIVMAEIDLEFLETVRKQIPIGFQKREDLYQVVDKLEMEHPQRVNTSYKLDSKKVAETFSIEDLGKKTVFCRCWKSSKFPLCDGSHAKHNKACSDNLGPVIVTKEKS